MLATLAAPLRGEGNAPGPEGVIARDEQGPGVRRASQVVPTPGEAPVRGRGSAVGGSGGAPAKKKGVTIGGGGRLGGTAPAAPAAPPRSDMCGGQLVGGRLSTSES